MPNADQFQSKDVGHFLYLLRDISDQCLDFALVLIGIWYGH